jgi:hypothetical protein
MRNFGTIYVIHDVKLPNLTLLVKPKVDSTTHFISSTSKQPIHDELVYDPSKKKERGSRVKAGYQNHKNQQTVLLLVSNIQVG